MLPGFLGLFSVIVLCGIAVVAVLAGYYLEFCEKIFDLEENGETVVFKNLENGVPVPNFNDTLMVYMLLYGDGLLKVIFWKKISQGNDNRKQVILSNGIIGTGFRNTQLVYSSHVTSGIVIVVRV